MSDKFIAAVEYIAKMGFDPDMAEQFVEEYGLQVLKWDEPTVAENWGELFPEPLTLSDVDCA